MRFELLITPLQGFDGLTTARALSYLSATLMPLMFQVSNAWIPYLHTGFTASIPCHHLGFRPDRQTSDANSLEDGDICQRSAPLSTVWTTCTKKIGRSGISNRSLQGLPKIHTISNATRKLSRSKFSCEGQPISPVVPDAWRFVSGDEIFHTLCIYSKRILSVCACAYVILFVLGASLRPSGCVGASAGVMHKDRGKFYDTVLLLSRPFCFSVFVILVPSRRHAVAWTFLPWHP